MKKMILLATIALGAAAVAGVFLLPSFLMSKPSFEGKIVLSTDKPGNDTYDIAVLESGKPLKVIGRLGQNPRWSPDGKKVAYIKTTTPGFSIAIYDAGNNQESVITPVPEPSHLAWLTNDKIMYSGLVENHAGPAEIAKYSQGLFLFDLKSSAVEKIYESLPGQAITDIDVGRSGNKVLFVINSHELYLGRLENNEIVHLKKIGYAMCARFSPDERSVAVETCYDQNGVALKPNHRFVTIGTHIFVLDLIKTTSHQITHKYMANRWPTWSPDGKKICYVSYRHQVPVNGSELYLINPDGTGEVKITESHPTKLSESVLFARTTDEMPDWTA